MNTDNINLALKITQQFGPERATPVEQRLKKTNLNLSEQEIRELLKVCEEIESFAFDLAEKVRDKDLDLKEFERKLRENYPYLQKSRIDKTISQAMYFSIK